MTACNNSSRIHLRRTWSASRDLRCPMFVFLCLFVACSDDLDADDRPKIRHEVEQLIQGLDASTLAERIHAERKLIELGPEVLPFLPAPELIESVAAREAVRRIRPQIERRAARESAAASHVTLEGERTVGDILEQIQRQTKNRLSLVDTAAGIKDRELSVKWDRTKFWDCLDELCGQGSLEWRFAKNSASIQLEPRRPSEPAALGIQRTGPFRLAVTNLETRDVIGNPNERILRIRGRLSIEPRLRPLFLSMDATNMNAVTDTDQLLSAWNRDAKYEFPVADGGREVPVQWDLLLPVGAVAKTVTIHGRFQCEIAAATQRIVFDQKALTPGTIRRRGGVTVRIRHVKFNSDHADTEAPAADIGITISYDVGGPAFESHRSWIFHNAAYLETKSGARTEFTDFETTQQADGAIAVDYHFRKIDAPADQYFFVYEAPTLIISVPVEINLEKLRLEQ